MRTLITLLAMVVLATSCHKDDVDVSTMNTNPMDADFIEGNILFSVDTIHTEVTVATIHEQHVTVEVHPEHFASPAAYEIWCIEENVPDTLKGYSVQHPDNRFELENYHVSLGISYCYRVQLRIEGEVIREEHICATAEL